MRRTYGRVRGRPTAFDGGSISDSSHRSCDRPGLSRKWAVLLIEGLEAGLVWVNDGTSVSRGAALPV
jgi:hypothetical protein